MFERLRKLFTPKKKEVASKAASMPLPNSYIRRSKYTATSGGNVTDSYYDPLSTLNPMSITSPLNALNYQDPTYKSDCGSSHHSTHSFDHGHSSSYDSGSCSSSYDSGSSSSSSDF